MVYYTVRDYRSLAREVVLQLAFAGFRSRGRFPRRREPPSVAGAEIGREEETGAHGFTAHIATVCTVTFHARGQGRRVIVAEEMAVLGSGGLPQQARGRVISLQAWQQLRLRTGGLVVDADATFAAGQDVDIVV